MTELQKYRETYNITLTFNKIEYDNNGKQNTVRTLCEDEYESNEDNYGFIKEKFQEIKQQLFVKEH